LNFGGALNGFNIKYNTVPVLGPIEVNGTTAGIYSIDSM